MILKEPKAPLEEGWVEDAEAARRSSAVGASTDPRWASRYIAWTKGPLRVLSSYDFNCGVAVWHVSVSRYGRPPPDEVVERVRKAFGMEEAAETGRTGRHRMLRLPDAEVVVDGDVNALLEKMEAVVLDIVREKIP